MRNDEVNSRNIDALHFISPMVMKIHQFNDRNCKIVTPEIAIPAMIEGLGKYQHSI